MTRQAHKLACCLLLTSMVAITPTAIQAKGSGGKSSGANAAAVPGSVFQVVNNSSQALLCSATLNANWVSIGSLPGGGTWRRNKQNGENSIHFKCNAPVQQVSYTLLPGTRYSLLRLKSGAIALSNVI